MNVSHPQAVDGYVDIAPSKPNSSCWPSSILPARHGRAPRLQR